MENFDYSVVPSGFGHCMAKCPQAETCLRHIAYEHLPANKTFVRMLVPRIAEQAQEKCQYYCPNTKVRYAKGFARIIDELSVKQAASFRERMIGKMGRKKYYASRKGDRLLPPAEQKLIRSVLRSLGASDENCFDDYIDCFVWE